MSGNCELGRGLRTREKNATEAGAGRFEKPAPDARAAPPEAHESLIGRKTVEEVPIDRAILPSILLTAGSYDLPAIQALITTGCDGGSWAGHGLR